MGKPEVRVCLCVDDGDVKVYIDKVDTVAGKFQRLTRDGEWQDTGLYEPTPDFAFTIPKDRAMDVLTQLTGESA